MSSPVILKCQYWHQCTESGSHQKSSCMIYGTKPHTLSLVRIHTLTLSLSLFDPAFFTQILSVATFRQPKSNSSLSQKRYPYHCPTHGLCGGGGPQTVQSKVCEHSTISPQQYPLLRETMWCDSWNPRRRDMKELSRSWSETSWHSCSRLHHCEASRVKIDEEVMTANYRNNTEQEHISLSSVFFSAQNAKM